MLDGRGRNHSIVMFCEINEGRQEGKKEGRGRIPIANLCSVCD